MTIGCDPNLILFVLQVPSIPKSLTSNSIRVYQAGKLLQTSLACTHAARWCSRVNTSPCWSFQRSPLHRQHQRSGALTTCAQLVAKFIKAVFFVIEKKKILRTLIQDEDFFFNRTKCDFRAVGSKPTVCGQFASVVPATVAKNKCDINTQCIMVLHLGQQRLQVAQAIWPIYRYTPVFSTLVQANFCSQYEE